jgi:phosphatidate phosphatase APP1
MGRERRVVRAARVLEERFDAFRFSFRRRFGLLEPFEILAYRGHGTRWELSLEGRVLERTGISRSGQADGALANLWNMARRFASAEVAGARVRGTFREHRFESTADVEGFFELRFELARPLEGGTAWHPVEVELLAPESPDGETVRTTGHVLVPGEADFGVISDLDDTVVRSNATSVLKMAWIVLLNNAHSRLPFEGVASFYEALRRGPGGWGRNPIFYVSSSPWNVYDVLEDFLDVNGVPAGPLYLKDWSPTVLGKHRDHKLGTIRKLLGTYPDLPFVLIGDSGEEDPEIYVHAAREHPGRIRTIYIRDVTTPARDAEVHAIADEAWRLGTEMVLAGTTADAAEHAARAGLIAPDS